MNGYVLVEIGVESATYAIFRASEVENGAVFSRSHSDFADMNCIEAPFAKK
jgi:hypothetical protein